MESLYTLNGTIYNYMDKTAYVYIYICTVHILAFKPHIIVYYIYTHIICGFHRMIPGFTLQDLQSRSWQTGDEATLVPLKTQGR